MRSLLVFLVLVFAAGFFGSRFEPGAWYAALEKPVWNPPTWVFGPVWTVLYVLIAVSAWLVWRRRGHGQRRSRTDLAMGFWGVQLVLNALWSWFFFGLQRPGLALFDIVALLVAIVATTIAFFRLHRLAGWMFVPYALWVTYATALNAAIVRLNP
jgi:translocator protein